ncbi:hypothetical protein B566_EDAN007279 [Ephemera danica]|nr:hypothetical protein B566_EDAN007279 [Ephemera danica]
MSIGLHGFADSLGQQQQQSCSSSSSFGGGRVPSSLSVHALEYMDIVVHPCSMASTLTLTPGRTRNLDRDMQALRLSRQDNPFLQVLASRESLLENCIDESESDAAILMSHVIALSQY